MSDSTSIEWTDATFNPWWGCTKISPGCDNCYAENLARRFGTKWGVESARRTFGEKHWNEPRKWSARAQRDGRRIRVFCASMADVFDNDAPAGERERLFALIRETPSLDWQLLTKRIGNAARMLPPDWRGGYANAWLGATIVNQEEADRDISKLLATPAVVHFLSCEPLLGPLDLTAYLSGHEEAGVDLSRDVGAKVGCCVGYTTPLDWVIAGGESGHRARPADPDWIRSLRDQCAAADVPFLFKQWGEHAPNWLTENDGTKIAGSEWIDRMGKKAAGRSLDGRVHSEFPE